MIFSLLFYLLLCCAFSPDYTCAAAKGINAGMDQEGGGTIAIDHMLDAMNNGLVNNQTVDNAFRRLFKVRIMLGMMVRSEHTFNMSAGYVWLLSYWSKSLHTTPRG